MLVIGSRGSKLALRQAEWVKDRLESLGASCRIEIIHTSGDKLIDAPLAKIGGKGLFTKEIEEALLNGIIDVAVHSLKDLPSALPAGLMLAAVPEREDPRDALVGGTLDGLPKGARVGSSSLRRAALMRALRSDVQVENIRGNLDTRLRKLDEGRYDAILLACAGLRRMGWEVRITQALEVDLMCPAVGQGALGIETRDDGGEAARICASLMHEPTFQAVTAERALLEAMGGGCQVPLGAHAVSDGLQLRLTASVASPDGGEVCWGSLEGPPSRAGEIGRELARRLLASGAQRILERVLHGDRKAQ